MSEFVKGFKLVPNPIEMDFIFKMFLYVYILGFSIVDEMIKI